MSPLRTCSIQETKFLSVRFSNNMVLSLALLILVSMLSACNSSEDPKPLLATKKVPDNIIATASARSVTLDWSGTPGASHYSVYWSNNPGVTRNTGAAIDVDKPHLAHKELNNGQTYFYVVTSHTNLGESVESIEVNATPQAAKPVAPIIKTAYSGDGRVTLDWDYSTGALEFTLYWDSKAGVTTNSNRIDKVISPFVHSNLNNGQPYYYRLVAENEQGSSELSQEVTATPQMPKPTAPVLIAPVTLTPLSTEPPPGTTSVSLTWVDYSIAQSYDVFWNTTGNVTENDAYINQVTSPYAHAPLSNNQTYYYRIRARNGGGVSALSNQVAVTPPDATKTVIDAPGQAPVTPIGLAEKNIQSGQLTLTWDTVDTATGYNLYWRTSANDPNKTKIANIQPPYSHIGLINGQDYFYSVSAINDHGESPLSNEIILRPEVVNAGVPIGLRAVTGDEWIALRWHEVKNASSYVVKLTADDSGITNTYADVSSPLTISTLEDGSPLVNNTPYSITVELIDGNPSEPIIATPHEPPAYPPGSLGAIPHDGEVVVQWSASKLQNPDDIIDEAVTAYRVYWNTRSGVTPRNGTLLDSSAIDLTANPLQFNHSGLTNGQRYYYVVTAINAGGESLASNEAWALPQVTPPDAPSNIWTEAGNLNVTIHFTEVANTNPDQSTKYNLYWLEQDATGGRGGTTAISYLTLEPDAYSTTQSSIVFDFDVNKEIKNGTTYVFRLSAFNDGGESQLSPEVNAIPQVPPPQVPPGNINAAGQDQAVLLNWDTVADATAYKIYWSTADNIDQNTSAFVVVNATPGEQAPINQTQASQQSYTHTDRVNGQIYYYQIAALNPGGESALSDVFIAQPQMPPPTPPANLIAVAGDTEVTLNWGPSPTATSYTVYWRNSNNPADPWTTLHGLQSGEAHIGLSNGQSYYYAITATNPGGESGQSNITNATPQAPLPGAPTGLAAAASDGQVSLNWHVQSGLSYTLYWSQDATDVNVFPNTIPDVRPTYIHTGLTNNSTYRYRLTAQNNTAQGLPSATVTVVPAPIVAGAPTALSAEGGDKHITLRWLPPIGASAETQYTLYWSATTGDGINGTAIASVTSPYRHTGLTEGQNYYYVITATNVNAAESAPSSEAMAQTLSTAVNTQLTTVQIPTSGFVNEPINISAQVFDQYNKPIQSGAVNISMVIAGANANATPTTLTDPELDGRYTASYTPQASGSDILTISVNDNSIDVPNNPFNITISPATQTITDALASVIDPALKACISRAASDSNQTFVHQFVYLPCDPSQDGIIVDLTGIDTFYNLASVELWNHQIADIGPLMSLVQLWYLDLVNNKITDTTLTALSSNPLPKLHTLHLSNLGQCVNANCNNITDLSSLQDITSLEILTFSNNEVTSLASLSKLTALTDLLFNNNQVADLTPISDLKSLVYLYFDDNQVSDLSPLSGMTSLIDLELSRNLVSDLAPISKLPLQYLFVDSNTLTDIAPLKDMASLVGLSFNYNNVTDISPVAGLTKLRDLEFINNNLNSSTPTDLSSLKLLKSLIFLYMSGNSLDDTELVNISELITIEELFISSNNILSIATVEKLVNLRFLRFNDNSVMDLTPLIGLTNLVDLEFINNNLNSIVATNLSPITGLTSLETLFLDGNSLNDIELNKISSLTNLTYLTISNNKIVDISELQSLVKLQRLYASTNQIVDLSPLAELMQLFDLRIRINSIDLTTLPELPSILTLYLGVNGISDISALSKLKSLNYIGLSVNNITDLSPLEDLPALEFIYAPSNQIDSAGIASFNTPGTFQSLKSLILDINIINDVTNLTGLVDKPLFELKLNNNKIGEVVGNGGNVDSLIGIGQPNNTTGLGYPNIELNSNPSMNCDQLIKLQESYANSNSGTVSPSSTVADVDCSPYPLAPIVQAPIVNGKNIELLWNTIPGQTYNVYRSTSPIFELSTAAILITNTSGGNYLDSTVVPGREYSYAVTAVEAQKESKPSKDEIATIPLSKDNIIAMSGDLLVNVDSSTGEVTQLSNRGLAEFDSIVHISYDNVNNILYGINIEGNQTRSFQLVEIDTVTGKTKFRANVRPNNWNYGRNGGRSFQ